MTVPPCLHARLREFLRAALRPPRPGLPYRLLIREVDDMLIYGIAPAASTVSDVTSQEMTIVVAGSDPDVRTVAVGGSVELSLTDGASVSVTQVDIDDAGNRSEPGPAIDFVANDTIPPPAPGQPTVMLLREE